MVFNEQTLKDLLSLTIDAGDSILPLYGKSNIEISRKNDGTLITEADILSHTIIVKGLQTITPNIPIISEEDCLIPLTVRKEWNEFWMIDPIDGTKGFINKSNDFCICLSYIKYNQPIFGLIYAPMTKTHYIANSASAAFKIINNDWQPLNAQKPSKTLKVIVGKYSVDKSKIKHHILTSTKSMNYDITGMGSALKFCLIADGQYDYYPGLGTCSEWDTAAGAFILKSAGGNVIDYNGNQLLYNTKSDFISPVFFATGDFILPRD